MTQFKWDEAAIEKAPQPARLAAGHPNNRTAGLMGDPPAGRSAREQQLRTLGSAKGA